MGSERKNGPDAPQSTSMHSHERAAVIQKEMMCKSVSGHIHNEVVLSILVSDLQCDPVGFSGRIHRKVQLRSPHVVRSWKRAE